MFSIGEFSRITSLPVKTLRFYHEKNLLAPAAVDPDSGYRYYDDTGVERARIIKALKELEFSLEEIRQVLAQCQEDEDLLEHLERRRLAVQQELSRQRGIADVLDTIIANEREERGAMQNTTPEIIEKTIPTVIIAGIRMQGRYCDCGQAFGRLGKSVGRYIAGKPMCLYYDQEYKEDGADFEPCFPVSKKVEKEGISVRDLPEVRCLTLLHHGPYEELGRSYKRLLEHAGSRNYKLTIPSREVYLKGPGMIFRGNPKKYVTEIQMPFEAT